MKKVIMIMCLGVFFVSCNQKALQKPTVEKKEIVVEKPPSIPKRPINSASTYLLIQGVEAKSQNKLNLAEQYFKRAIESDSLNDGAYYELSILEKLPAKNNPEKALAYIEKAVEINPSEKWYRGYLGQLLVDNGQTEKGINVFKSLVKDYPKDIEYKYDLAYSYESIKRYDDALKIYNQLEETHGFDPKINHQKHILYFEQGDVKKAIAELEEIVEKEPSYYQYSSYLAEHYLSSNTQKAEHYLNLGLEQSENDFTMNLVGVKIYSKLKNREKTAYHTKKVLNNAEVNEDRKILSLVQLMDTASEDELTSSVLTSELETYAAHADNRAKMYSLLGDFYSNSGSREQAIKAFDQSIKASEKAPYAVHEQRLILLSRGKDFQALANASKETQIAYPKQFLPYYMRGFSNYQLGNYQVAIDAMNKASEFEAQKDYIKVDVLFYLGESYQELKQYQNSFEAYDKALLLDPENEAILNNYSFYLAKRKQNLDKALKMIQLANKVYLNNANLQDTYSYVLFQRGQYKQALEKSLVAFKNDEGESPTIAERVGDSYAQLNQTAKALSYWKMALERGSKSPLVKQKIKAKKYIQ